MKEQLKEMIMKLEEQDVMIVLSDHGNCLNNEFKYIADFWDNRMKLKSPSTPSFHPRSLLLHEEEEIENKKYYKYIRKVVKLLEEKIYLR